MFKDYRSFHQLPFCCVPATLQWVLYRRGLDILDQETIGVALGLRMPEKFAYLLSNPEVVVLPDDAPEHGTQIFTKGYTINEFFEKFAIPLSLSQQYRFNGERELNVFLRENVKTENDVIIRFHNAVFKKGKGAGHLAVVTDFDHKTSVATIGDPNPPFLKRMTLQEILRAMSGDIDGQERGMFVITSVK